MPAVKKINTQKATAKQKTTSVKGQIRDYSHIIFAMVEREYGRIQGARSAVYPQ